MTVRDKIIEAEQKEVKIIDSLQAVYNQASQEPGTIYVHRGKYKSYRVKPDGEGKLVYIKKCESARIRRLAEKKYALKMIRVHSCNLKRIRRLLYGFEDDSVLREELSELFPKPVNPLLLPYDEYAELWETSGFESNNYESENCTIETRKGVFKRCTPKNRRVF